ncbi:MAG: N-acetylneuraminate synthase family protein [Gammaproteobacteria bacterium]|nr:N-acetylneuraminate synthase family protein [Gammaproteobacteria bacterium]
MHIPRVVAEIGCNHKGDMDIARRMIEVAARFAGADYVKFQKRCNRELLTAEEYDAPHPNPANSYGRSYGEHREFLEFSPEQHRELLEVCRTHGIGYSTSVWDPTSAAQMAALEPDYLKVPSACNLNFDLLGLLAREYRGDIHISVGMTTPEEEEDIVAFLENAGAAGRTVLYACTSGYPVPFEQVCLLEIRRLTERYGTRVKEIAFSGHHLGIAVDVAAVTLGATWVERHFTLDRTWKGTDHAASLEPDGLRKLVRDVRAVASSLTYKEHSILAIEEPQRAKLKRMPGVHVRSCSGWP